MGTFGTYIIFAAQIIVPKVQQGFIAAVNDYYTAQLACRLFETDAYTDVAVRESRVQFRPLLG